MTLRFGKWPIYLGYGLVTGAQLKYLRNGLTMLEIA